MLEDAEKQVKTRKNLCSFCISLLVGLDVLCSLHENCTLLTFTKTCVVQSVWCNPWNYMFVSDS